MSGFQGWLGEKWTAMGLWLGLDRRRYQRFHNVIVPTNNGTTQIDHVVVGLSGIFVIENKEPL